MMLRTLLCALLSFFVPSAEAHWRSQPSGASALRAISGNDEQLYIVGARGTILGSKDGISWSTQRSQTTNDLNAILAIDTQLAIAIGDFGTILTTKDAGASWTTQSNELYQNLNAIWGSKDQVYIAGTDGLILRSTDAGATWSTLKTGTNAPLLGLWGSSPNIYAVGTEVALQSKDSGKTWTKLKVGSIDKFTSVWGASANEIYITEENGKLYSSKNAGQTWTWVSTKQEGLSAVIGGAANEPLVLSLEGILRSGDKGKKWPLWKKSNATSGGFRRGDGALFFVGSAEILTLGPSTGLWSQADLDTTDSLRAIWGSQAAGIFVSSFLGNLFYFKDGTWTKITNKNTPNISSLWGSDEGALFALATNGTLHLSTNKGQSWSQQKLPVEGAKLRHIWGTGDKLFLVGSTILASDDKGRSWREQKLPEKELSEYSIPTSPPILLSAWGSSKDDVYIVGESGTIFHTSNGGTTWKQQQSNTSAPLRAIWGSSKEDVYIVGERGTILHTKDQGNTWRPLSGLSPFLREHGDKEDLYSIWGSGKDDVYIAGSINARGLILRSSNQGKTWSHSILPSYLTAIWGLSAGEVYTLAMDGTILQTKKGTSWEMRDYPQETHINAVWQSSKGTVYAVGTHGAIQFTKDLGKTWERQHSGVGVSLSALWGVSDNELYASGSGGLLLSTKNGGETWEIQASGTTEGLFDLWGDGKGSVYAVGGKGVILRSKDKGKTWSKLTSDNNKALYCIWGSGATLYAAGASGVLLKSTNGGASWSKQKSGVDKTLVGIWGSSKGNVYLVGDGALLHSKDGGKTWSNSPAARKGLRDIWGASAEQLYAVGEPGSILHTKDGGKTWALQTTGTKDVLSDVVGLSDGSVLVAGDGLYMQDGGKTWTVELVAKKALQDLWSDGKNLYAVGGDGTIWHSKEGESSVLPPPSSSVSASSSAGDPSGVFGNLQSIFGVDGVMYAAGYVLVPEKKKLSKPKGVFLSKDKSGWTAQPEIDWMLSDVWVSRSGGIYAVGETFIAPMPAFDDEPIKNDDKSERKGALLTSSDGGKNWRVRELSFVPLSIWGDEKAGICIVGEEGTIVYSKDQGNLWETKQSNVSTALTAVWGSGSTLYAVGEDGVILQTEDAGQSWRRQRSNTNDLLSSIWGEGSELYAIGDFGTVLYTKDKGKTWEKQPSLYYRHGTAVWVGNGEVFTTGQDGTRDGVVMTAR